MTAQRKLPLVALFCLLALLIACKPKTKTETAAKDHPSTVLPPDQKPDQHVDPFPDPNKDRKQGDEQQKEIVYPGGVTNTELLAKLQESRDQAAPAQRQLIERQMEMVRKFDPKGMNEDMLREVVEQSIELMLDYGEIHKDDYEVQLDMATTMFLAGFTAHNAGVDEEQYKQKGKDMSIELVKRFPDKASAHAQLGFVYFRTGEMEKSRQSFDRCIELEPENGFCRAYLDEMKKLAEEKAAK